MARLTVVSDTRPDEPDRLDVVTFGEAMVLLLAEPGVPLAEATTYRRLVAGSEANVAIGVARLGRRVGFVGRVGADAFGDVVRRAIRGEGVDASRLVTDPDATTGVIVRDAHAYPARQTEVVYLRAGSAGSRLAPSDIDADYIAGARILHLTGITPVLSDSAAAATDKALAAAKAAGVTVVLDPNIRRRLGPLERTLDRILALVDSADVVLAGADEARLLTGAADTDTAVERLLARGPALVVIKDGAAGAWASDGRDVVHRPAVPATVVDPVGAGDAFAAGFLAATLDGADVAACLHAGAVLGAMAVSAVGDVEGLPHRQIPASADIGDTVDVRR